MQHAPRFITKFCSHVERNIEPSLCGKNTIFVWPTMVESHTGAMACPSLLYNIFREKVSDHLEASDRARQSGTLPLLLKVLPYCFKGAPTTAPHAIYEQAVRLAGYSRTSFKVKEELINGEPVTKALIHHWPSWLMMGSFKAVN